MQSSLRASVSNVELFRSWRNDEELDMEWLLRHLRGEEPQSPQMMAGEAFHKAIENANLGETAELVSEPYRFYIQCEGSVELPPYRELKIDKQYGDLLVRGRVDGLKAKTVTDYKTTGQFDADRLLEGYQWRFYLDMLECDTFIWKVFVLREFDNAYAYDVTQTHELTQKRYPGMAEDCHRLAADYAEFARANEAALRKAA